VALILGLAALASCAEPEVRPVHGSEVLRPASSDTVAPRLVASKVTASEPAAPKSAAPGKPAVIDDFQFSRRLEVEANKLYEADKTTPIKTLIAQLKNTRCDVDLARPSGQRLTAADIYTRCKDSVVVMGSLFKCEKCGKNHCGGASGFILTESGIAVTNYHVVNNPKNLTLVACTSDGKVYPVESVLAASEANDVAIVQIGGSGFKPLPVTANVPVGSDVYVISHPDGRFYTMASGIVSRYGTMMRRRNQRTPILQITAEYARGSSGGPVLGSDGSVVGMVSSTVSVYYNDDHSKQEDLQMVVNECVPAAQILELINPK
jgi:serine protease Do